MFFLISNPDGIYSPLGPASVLNRLNGRYIFGSLSPNLGVSNYRELYLYSDQLDYILCLNAEEFEQNVLEEIRRQHDQ